MKLKTIQGQRCHILHKRLCLYMKNNHVFLLVCRFSTTSALVKLPMRDQVSVRFEDNSQHVSRFKMLHLHICTLYVSIVMLPQSDRGRLSFYDRWIYSMIKIVLSSQKGEKNIRSQQNLRLKGKTALIAFLTELDELDAENQKGKNIFCC